MQFFSCQSLFLLSGLSNNLLYIALFQSNILYMPFITAFSFIQKTDETPEDADSYTASPKLHVDVNLSQVRYVSVRKWKTPETVLRLFCCVR